MYKCGVKDKGFYATSSCTSLIKHTPTKQHYVNDDVNDQLQLLPRNFCDVFLDELPFGLPLERTITHGIDLMLGSKLLSQSVYLVKIVSWKNSWMTISYEDLFAQALLHRLFSF